MAQAVTDGLSVNNPLFGLYAFYCSILVLKMLFMSPFTGFTRFKTKAFANPEDVLLHKVKVKTDDRVERVRRAHLNDLENIPVFFIVSLIYILTNPSYFITAWLFRIFTIARFAHTFVYAIVVIPQPARAMSFLAGLVVTSYMAIQNVLYFLG